MIKKSSINNSLSISENERKKIVLIEKKSFSVNALFSFMMLCFEKESKKINDMKIPTDILLGNFRGPKSIKKYRILNCT